MSRAVERDLRTRDPPGRSTSLTRSSRLSSRLFTVQHCASGLDIFQGIGIAAAVGIRPFLPALAAGALAAGDVEIHFDHTDFSFLQSAPFLLAMAVCAIALAVLERRVPAERLERGPGGLILAVVSLALGALFFAARCAAAGM